MGKVMNTDKIQGKDGGVWVGVWVWVWGGGPGHLKSQGIFRVPKINMTFLCFFLLISLSLPHMNANKL